MIPLLDADAVRAAVPPAGAPQGVRGAMKALHRGGVVMPPRQVLPMAEGAR